MSIELLKKYNIWAKKSLGQNFLIDENKVQSIADFYEIQGKNIVEVWPGYGALTEKLIPKNPESLTLVELDGDMVEILQDRFAPNPPTPLPLGEGSLDILNQDVLEYHPDFETYCVIANIPYYITSPILRHFLYEVENKPEKMLILMQQDVGDKILLGQPSPPAPLPTGEGSNKKTKSSVLSLFIAKKARVEEVLLVPKECFHPMPKVESSVLSFEIHDDYENIDDEQFLEIIKKWFWSPRKKLLKNFVNTGLEKQKILQIFEQLDIDESVRGEDLDIGKWCELVEEISKK